MYLDAHTLENLIRHTYNLRKPFSEKTLNYIKKWCDEEVAFETISDAFVACIKNTNRISFTYVDNLVYSLVYRLRKTALNSGFFIV